MHPSLSRLVAEQSIVIPMIDTLSRLLQPTSSSSEDQHISLAGLQPLHKDPGSLDIEGHLKP